MQAWKAREAAASRPPKHGLTSEQAYILASVAVDLRVGQVVDVPNFVMTAVLNLDVFEE